MFLDGKAFQVIDGVIDGVSILVMDLMSLRDWPESIFPNVPMQVAAPRFSAEKISLMGNVLTVRITSIPMAAIFDDLGLG
jgi:hypothetical protein